MKILRRHWIDFLVLGVCLLFAWWLMSSTFGFADGAIRIDSKLYSDFGAHLPLIRSFSLGWNFPPAYPFFAGEPIRYHYSFYLLVGFTERMGVRIDLAINLWSAGGFALLLFMVYRYAYKLFSSVAAGILALGLFLFNGSLAWVEYFVQHGWTIASLVAISQQQQFASFGPWSGRLVSAFWNWNIYTNQRHLGLSYGLLLLLLYPLVTMNREAKKSFWHRLSGKFTALYRGLREKVEPKIAVVEQRAKRWWSWWFLVIIVGFIVFPLLHQAAYIMLVPLTICWLVLRWPSSKRFIPVYGVALVASLVIFKISTPQADTPPVWLIGYLSQDTTILGMLQYWLYNLGVYIVLLPVLLIWSAYRKQWWLWSVLPFFVAANLFRFSPDMINNHKLVTFFMIALQIVTAGFLVAIVKKTKLLLPVVAVLVFSLTFSGVLDMFPIINDYGGAIPSYQTSQVQQWILHNTSPQAQFLSSSYMYNPASLAGRFLYLDYGYHAWSMGYNDQHKRATLPALWAGMPNEAEWCRLLQKEHIDAIIVGPNETSVEDGRINVAQSYVVQHVPPTFSSDDGWNIWVTDRICLAYEEN